MAEVMKPNPVAPTCRPRLAITGSETWNSYVRQPATAIITRGTPSCGVARMYLRPSRSWPRARGVGVVGESCARFRVLSEATTATKLPALTRKQTPSPTLAIRIPATAGPTVRATLTSTEFRLTAFRRCSGPTSSIMNDCRAGFSNALLRPSRAARAPICHTCTVPVTVSRPRIRAWTPIALWSAIIILRLSTRSAITPP